MEKTIKNKNIIIGLSIFLILTAMVLLLKSSFAAPEERKLIIKNSIQDKMEEKNLTFDYLIELDDTTVNKTFSNVEFKNGQAIVSIPPDEEISIVFDANYKYKVSPLSENQNITYISQQIQSGELSLEEDSIVVYEMKRIQDETNKIENENEIAQTPSNEGQNQKEPEEILDMVTNSATIVDLDELEDGEYYVIFRAIGGKAYLLSGKGNAKLATTYETKKGGKITWPKDSVDYKNIIWQYQGPSDHAMLKSIGDEITSYLTIGKETYGVRPIGTDPSYVTLTSFTSPAIRISNDNHYLGLSGDKETFMSTLSPTSLSLAKLDKEVIKVAFDASNGNETIYEGATERNKILFSGESILSPTEEEIELPKNYNYKLVSWVNIETGEEVSPGSPVTLTKDTTYYANYQAENYNIGVNKDIVNSVSTSEFMTTKLYDINDLFNLNSAIKTQSRDFEQTKESWDLVPYGQLNVLNKPSLGLSFFDTSQSKDKGRLSLLNGRDKINSNRQETNGENYYDGIISQGITEDVKNGIFNDNTLGITYVGEGDYLYQFDEKTGYYYYDSTKNAASYNQQDNRFYVYNYTYGTTKSQGEDNTDFLPFNYMSKEEANAGETLGSSGGRTNYWFGMESNINFILPDDAGSKDSTGKYQNRGLNDNDMVFKFTGDDDIWIYIDNELVLDLGGVHDVIYGEINFSTGVATIAQRGAEKKKDSLGYISFNKNEISNTTKIQQYDISHIKAGSHTLKIYYLERGASQSNAGIYFNVSDKYKDNAAIEVSKEVKGTKTEESFNFHIKFVEPITGKYGNLEVVNGEGNFTLKDGEKIPVTGLPSGITYEITETITSSYESTIEINSQKITGPTARGTVIGGRLEQINYINKNIDNNTPIEEPKPPQEDINNENVPNTIDNIIKYIVLFIVSGIGIVASIIVIVKKKQQKEKEKKSEIEEIELLK